jgi:chemosensory pili system protein ChpA (sensor histidine kinase/response regulator)
MHALLVRCADRLFALPTAIVEQTLIVDRASLDRIRAAGQLEWRGRSYPAHVLRQMLGMEDAGPASRRRVPFVLVKAGDQRAAFEVDELFAHQEVVMKNVGVQVARVAGISGAAVLGSGEVVLILNPLRLAQRALLAGGATGSSHVSAPDAAPSSVIMVVDDSVTVRRITARLLARRGYGVAEARNGQEALSQLERATPRAVLLDIEMPGMDGFELLRRMRGDARLRDVPVIIISSRSADKHREQALRLGANVFLGKPFAERELLERLDALIGAAHR